MDIPYLQKSDFNVPLLVIGLLVCQNNAWAECTDGWLGIDEVRNRKTLDTRVSAAHSTFDFRHLPPGQITLDVSARNYVRESEKVLVEIDGVNTVEILMSRGAAIREWPERAWP